MGIEQDIARAQKTLDLLGVKVRKSIERKAMRAGNAVNVKALRRNAPIGKTRRLKRSMGQQVRTLPNGEVEGVAGQNRKKVKRGTVHIHIVDQDTRPHVIPNAAFTNSAGELIRGDLDHPGTDGQEFVEETQREERQRSLKAFADKLEKEIDKEAIKLGALA